MSRSHISKICARKFWQYLICYPIEEWIANRVANQIELFAIVCWYDCISKINKLV